MHKCRQRESFDPWCYIVIWARLFVKTQPNKCYNVACYMLQSRTRAYCIVAFVWHLSNSKVQTKKFFWPVMLHSYLSNAFFKGSTKRMLQCNMLHAAKLHTSVPHCSVRFTTCLIKSIKFLFHVVIFSWDLAEETLIVFIVLEVLENHEKNPNSPR